VTLREATLWTLNALALVTGVAYAVLAARRNRLCWIAGGVCSACAAVLAALSRLPMQAILQVIYVGMALYGWWSWVRSTRDGELNVGTWPVSRHLLAGIALAAVSLGNAYWLRQGELSAWPLLDSLSLWFSLFATWLAARARLENWLYWIVLNALGVFLFHEQGSWGMAVLSALLVFIAVAGFVAWRRRLQAQA
jgi:nicotinamide mononucleotide transporter